jgi:4-hydroxy-tetrahydrodipicolinate reductase
MASSVQTKPRIVIYGVGQYGQYITRFAAEKGWPVVAAYNRAGAKIGQDLGRVAGLGRDLGVIVQDCETADYAGLEADIGIVTQTNLLRVNLPAYKRLLGAGLNVLCHGSQSYYPFGCDAGLAAEIDALAKANNVTFTGGGIWDMSRIWSGILVAGPCTSIKSLFHSSITDAAGQLANAQQAEQVGIGFSLEKFDQSGLRTSPMAIAYKTIPEQVLVALGFTISNTSAYIEPVIFDVPIDSALMGRVIPAGECAGTRIIGEIETAEGVTARTEVELRLFRPGEIEHMFWSVDGLPRNRVRVERDDSAHATASNLFNRIPDVIAAPPGVVVISQLGPMKNTALA